MTSELKLTARALAEKAAKTAAADAKAQAAALEAGAASDKEAAARSKAFMENWLAEFDAPAAEAASHAALAAFEEAVQKDPLMQVWLAYLRSRYRAGMDGGTAQNFASQVGVPAPVYYPNPGTEPFFGAMQRAMEHLAQRLEGERQAEIFEDLARAAEGE